MASIEKRTSKNGEVSYRIKVSLGYDEDGKQIFDRSESIKFDNSLTKRQIQSELNKRAALFEADALRRKENMNDRITEANITFRQLAEEWFELIEQTGVQKQSSIELMKTFRPRVYEAIGGTEVRRITYRQIQNFILGLSREGANKRTGHALAAKTQNNYLYFISDVMNYAIKCGIILNNPCRNITVAKEEKIEKDIYSLDELQKLIRLIDDEAPTKFKLYFLLMAHLGLRRGEVMGLEFGDFDLKNQTVSINRTSNYRNKVTGIYTSTPKTKYSRRTLHFPAYLVDILEELRSELNEQRAACGDQWHESDRLFVTWCGKPLHPNIPYKWLNTFCDSHGIAFKGLHSFRHAFATQAITNGADIATVSSLLGHSQTSTTLNIYTHAVQKANAKAMDMMENLLRNQNKTHE